MLRMPLPDGTGVVELKYVYRNTDRHGNERIYFMRRQGAPKIRLRAPAGTQAFFDEYRAALDGIAPSPRPAKARQPAHSEGSIRSLVEKYLVSAAFKRLGPTTSKRRRVILEEICDEEIDGVQTGPLPFALMEPKHVAKIRDVKSAAPEAANMRLKSLRQLFRWAMDVEVDLAKRNPAIDVRYISTGSEGFHTWTVDEIRQYEARHPVGTKARLALDLLLYTGVRRGDVIRLGRQMEADGFLKFTEQKNKARKPKHRTLPILPPLRTSIDAVNSGHLTYLTAVQGKPYTHGGFGNWFKRRCVEAGLGHCSAHGLRKGGATIAADRGATVHQLKAIYGWRTLKDAARYTEKADMDRLAKEAMHLVIPERKKTRDAG